MGRMGNGGQGYAARIWGLEPRENTQNSDHSRPNTDGDLMMGLKI